MFTVIINDCRDDNARARQTSRVGSLASTNISFIGVDSDLEAGMQLIDVLDATTGREGLVLVNVAPRGDHASKWENGTPFAYFWYKKTLVITSVDGFALSAVKKLNLTNQINLLDIHETTEAMLKANFITEAEAKRIPYSQFRSFDFTPRAGVFMMQGNHLPSASFDLDDVPDLPRAVWAIDNFGNCKTTLTPEDIDTNKETQTRYGSLPYFEKLRDLSDGETALVRGSSGLDDTRFLAVITQRRSFAKNNNVMIGDDVFEDKSYFRQATE
ncbi:MAG: hypothetical protein H6779_03135 [Candidatus Nomurabacteria bacterium]|nr:MAG: hypothetical protein H6779_03135 [Candidatus Nomurabacteria bacterium]